MEDEVQAVALITLLIENGYISFLKPSDTY